MARPRATPEQREAQRRRIRAAAAELHADGGIDAVTVRAVSERAGVSQGTLYSYFSSLSELMRSLWLGPAMRADAQLAAQIEDVDDPLDRVRVLLRAFADFALANPEVHRSAMLYVRQSGHEPAEPLEADDLAFHRLLVTAVSDGQRNGWIRPGDPRQLAQTLWAGVHGALALPVNAEAYDLASQADLVAHMIDVLVDGLAI